jgi:putative transposase
LLGHSIYYAYEHRVGLTRAGIGDYLMDYYNRQRPHTFNGGMPPVVAEEKLKILSGIS